MRNRLPDDPELLPDECELEDPPPDDELLPVLDSDGLCDAPDELLLVDELELVVVEPLSDLPLFVSAAFFASCESLFLDSLSFFSSADLSLSSSA